MAMTETDLRRDAALVRYVEAVERGDLDTLAAIWQQAEADPSLEKVLVGFNDELLLESTGTLVPEDASPDGAEQVWRGEQQAVFSQDLLPLRPSSDELVDACLSEYCCRVLVVDDEKDIRNILKMALEDEFDVLVADSAAAARETLAEQPVDILLTDERLKEWPRPECSGLDLIAWTRERWPHTVPILMTGYPTPDNLVEAISRSDVFCYIPKPTHPERMLGVVRRAAHGILLERKNKELLGHLKQLNLELEERVRERTRKLVSTIHELQQKNKMLDGLAMTDQLTRLPNRRAMDNLVSRELLWRRRYPGPLALGLIDLDHFHNINEQHQWSGGDRVLAEVCKCMSRSIRTIDFLGRYGGEEFLLIAPQTEVSGAAALGERIRAQVERLTVIHKGQTIRVTVSLGFAVVEAGLLADFDQLRDVYEAALLEAKQVRNRCCVRRLAAPAAHQAGG
jgi:diguanylate cyclase (GGDEF)-like protein